MKKITLLIFSTLFSLGLFAQAIPDATYTDCNSNSRSIYQVLAAGKVLVVANAGTNCSICMGHASSVANLANTNASTIEVWGAITTKTGGNPGCAALNNWVSNYSWTNVFSFLDVNKDWFQVATPKYTVINPADSSVAYAGSNWNTAQNTALQLANTVGLPEHNLVNQLWVTDFGVTFNVANTVQYGEARLIDITGKTLEMWQFSAPNQQVELKFASPKVRGIYFLQLTLDGKSVVKKLQM